MGSDYNGERYEKYNFFDSTEDDLLVSDILVNLEDLINQFTKPSKLTWAVKRKRSAPNSPPATVIHLPPVISSPPPVIPSPPPVTRSPPPPPPPQKEEERQIIRNSRNKEKVESPSSPLGYSPNEAYDNNRKKSNKRKYSEAAEKVKELTETKEQLTLSLDNVKKFHQTLWNFNIMLKAKKDEFMNAMIQKKKKIKSKSKTPSFEPKVQTTDHQLPHLAPQQQEYIMQNMLAVQYFQQSLFPATNGGGVIRDEKALRAADARKRRMDTINNKKKNSVGTIQKKIKKDKKGAH